MARYVIEDSQEKRFVREPSIRERLARAVAQSAGGGPVAIATRLAHETSIPINELWNQLTYGAGGAVTDVAASAGLQPNIAAGLGFGANVGLQALPVILSGQIGKLGAPALRGTAENLMESALKPTLAQHERAQAERAVKTMLEKGFSPTRAGIGKMSTKVAELNKEIAQKIAASTATIKKGDVGKPLQEVMERVTKQASPSADISTVRRTWTEFQRHPLLKGKQDIPIQLAQEIKQGTQRAVREKYGELGTAATEAQKALARGLRLGIARAEPSVVAPLKEEADLLNALTVAERRVWMDMNKNPGGLAWLASNPIGFAAFMADKSAAFKGLIARALYSGSERIPQTAAMAGTSLLMEPENRERLLRF